MAGGFSSEDGIFKALAMGAPGMVGKNIAKWIKEDDLPKTVSEYGRRPE
jgi:hypothetical protein